jgi:rod shape-determining protein MreD
MPSGIKPSGPVLRKPYPARIVIMSLLLGLALNLLPWEGWLRAVRPDWLLLTLLFWNVHLPLRVGLLPAFGLGLLMDMADGTLFGMHALGYGLASYAALVLHRRVRNFGSWRQAVHVLPMLVLADVSVLVTGMVAGSHVVDFRQLLSGLTGFLFWPLLSALLLGLSAPAAGRQDTGANR